MGLINIYSPSVHLEGEYQSQKVKEVAVKVAEELAAVQTKLKSSGAQASSCQEKKMKKM